MENYQKINLFQLRDFGGNFEVFLAFLKHNYSAILKAICIFIPVMIVVAYFLASLQTAQATTIDDIIDLYTGFGIIIGSMLSLVVSFLISTFTICYMVKYSESQNGVVSPSQVWNKVFKIALPLICCHILYSIVVVIGSLLCIIPGVIVAIYLLFYSFAYAAEDISIIDSFTRSWKLVQERWWSTFGFMLLIGIIAVLVGLVFNIPVYLIAIGTMIGADFFSSEIYLYSATFLSQTGQVLLMPISTIAMGILYFSYRADIDGIEIDDNIDLIGSIGNSDGYNNTQQY